MEDEIVEDKKNKQILIHEIPFDVNKANLVKRISDIIYDKKIDGIVEVRDESDREEKVRIAIDLKKDADENKYCREKNDHCLCNRKTHKRY